MFLKDFVLYTKWQSSKKKKSQIWLLLYIKFQKQTQNPSIFLATTWNLSLKSGDLKKKVFKIWQICAIFSMENSFEKVKIIRLGRNLANFQNFFSQ